MMDSSMTMHLEGNRIIMDVVDDGEDSGGVMLVHRAPTLQQQEQKAENRSFMERLMGVRNKQCELSLACISDKYESQRQYQWSKRQSLEDRVRYDHRVMKVDIHRNWLERQKRRNPTMDTSFDELLIKHASKYLNVDPDDCCHLRLHNRYPLRNTLVKCGCTPTIAKARKLIQDLEIDRELEKNRKNQADLEDAKNGEEFEGSTADELDAEKQILNWTGRDPPQIKISNGIPVPSTSTKSKLKRRNTWNENVTSLPVLKQGNTSSNMSLTTASFPPLTPGVTKQQQQLQMRRASLDLGPGRRPSIQRSVSSQDVSRTMSRASSAGQQSTRLAGSAKIGSAKRDPPRMWLDEEEETEYDNEEIMHKLREAGIIKSNEVINFSGRGPVSTFLNQDEQPQQPKQSPSSPARVVRKRLTLDMLKEEDATIQRKIAAFYEVLERDKNLEYQKALLFERMKRLKQEEEEQKQKVSLGKWETPHSNEEKRKFNLLSSFRSKIMKEKWKIATSKIILEKCEEEMKKTVDEVKEATAPIEQQSHEPTPKKVAPVEDHLLLSLRKSREQRAKQLENEPFQGFGYQSRHGGGAGPPIYTKRRSDRHTATFKLGKIVEEILRKKTKHQLMEYNHMKAQMMGNATTNLETIEENEDQA